MYNVHNKCYVRTNKISLSMRKVIVYLHKIVHVCMHMTLCEIGQVHLVCIVYA